MNMQRFLTFLHHTSWSTYSHRQVLEDMEIVSAFTGVLHVPNLSQPEHVLAVLEESDAFSKRDLQKIQHDLRGARWVYLSQAGDLATFDTNK